MEYTQLDFARFETRFLRLAERPTQITEPIRFEISIASLNNPPKYDALSYCWGDTLQISTIEVDGRSVEVSKNLAEALFNAGLEVGDHIWADAICIDQSNLYEKSYQIMRMGQIYSQAEQTVVWLGNEARYSKYAADLLADRRIRRSAESFLRGRNMSWMNPFTESLRTSDNSMAANEVAFRDAVKDHTFPARALQGLRELLSRPYWERAWIIQEISKARRLTIKCGDLQLDLNALLYVSHKAADVSARTRSLLDAIINFRIQEQRGPGAFNRMSLYEAIMQSRYSLAKDERDKVYALLGLTSDGSDLIPTPTYTESIEQIWLNLTKAIIQSRRQTNVLLLSRWAPLAYRFPKMPHWAVDWNDIAYNVPPWLASRAKKSPDALLQSHELLGSKIRIRGRHIATINTVEGQGFSSVKSPRRRTSVFSARGEINNRALNLMNTFQSMISGKFLTGEHLETSLGSTDLTDALARMIRDADKGMPSVNYNFVPICEVLYRLGRVVIQDPIWHWAKEYNSSRSSESSTIESGDSLGRQFASPADDKTTLSLPRRELVRRPRSSPPLSPPVPPPKKQFQRGTPIKASPTVQGGDIGAIDGKRQTAVTETLASPSPSPVEVPPSPNPGMPPIAAFRYWELVLKSLDTYPEFPLRFAVTNDDDLIMACDGARPRDEIYDLDHSSLPVLLRKSPMGDYRLVGEVCLGRSANGEWNLARESSDDPFGPIFGPESPTRSSTISGKSMFTSEDWLTLTIGLDLNTIMY
ncbi:hypothetical protein ACEPPN_016067 [Leptodophora sp. 'Broadleaf-Isolate-01']